MSFISESRLSPTSSAPSPQIPLAAGGRRPAAGKGAGTVSTPTRRQPGPGAARACFAEGRAPSPPPHPRAGSGPGPLPPPPSRDLTPRFPVLEKRPAARRCLGGKGPGRPRRPPVPLTGAGRPLCRCRRPAGAEQTQLRPGRRWHRSGGREGESGFYSSRRPPLAPPPRLSDISPALYPGISLSRGGCTGGSAAPGRGGSQGTRVRDTELPTSSRRGDTPLPPLILRASPLCCHNIPMATAAITSLPEQQ